jgi:tryptophanyl-tRNA synthetase
MDGKELNPHLRLERSTANRLNQSIKTVLKKSVDLHFKTSWLILCMEIICFGKTNNHILGSLVPCDACSKALREPSETMRKNCRKVLCGVDGA